MSVFGNILKEKREKMGYSIQDISEITTIQQRYIQALEDDNFEIIPGEYYVRSFVKQYATILKMDSQKLIKKYEEYIAESNKKRPEILLQDELRKPTRPNEKDEDSEEINVIPNKTSQEQEEVQEVTVANEMIEELGNQIKEEVSNVEENEVAEEIVEVMEKESENNFVDENAIEVENVIVLDSDGLDDELDDEVVEEYILEEIEETEEVPPIPYSENNEDVPTTKMNKKLVILLSLMVVLMLGLIWFIPNVMSSFAPKQTVTTTPSSTLAPTTTSTSTTQTTTAQTTTTTTTQTTTQQTTAAPRPTNEPADLYVISSDVAQTTYGLGRSFANYTGEYVVTLTATQPVWIRVEIFGQKVHEGTMTPNIPYRFNAYNNAGTMKIRVGLSSALSVTFNDQPVNVPTHQRVQEYTFNFAR